MTRTYSHLDGEQWEEDERWYGEGFTMKPSEEFDSQVENITQKRGAVYGHPLDDFSKIAELKAALPDYANPAIQHCAEMICVKLARLGQTPGHIDSLVDIAGYARTWAMLLDRLGS